MGTTARMYKCYVTYALHLLSDNAEDARKALKVAVTADEGLISSSAEVVDMGVHDDSQSVEEFTAEMNATGRSAAGTFGGIVRI